MGLDCPTSGDLINEVVRIIRHHKPEYFILENVPNLLKHDKGKTWKKIKMGLEVGGTYEVDAKILSPHKFGVPQIRERVFIVGRKGGLAGFTWPKPSTREEPRIDSILERRPKEAKKLNKQVIECLKAWQEFLDKFPSNEQLPTFPIWTMEFGATYPYASTTPFAVEKSKLTANEKSNRLLQSKRFQRLPSHARTKQLRFPD